MTYYMRSGNTFRISSKESLDLHEYLPAGNYVIKEDMFHNLFLEKIESFSINTKLYGDTTRHTARIFSTFIDREAATGVLLNGEKGSGKSLLAKNLSSYAATQGIPTIVINQPWVGDKFNGLIQSIEQPCVVLFDEFEKVYDSVQQEQMLTLLDGVFPSKKLFILTCNNKWRVDSHMRNRPGRIFYMLDFNGLDPAFILEYCEDQLNAKEHTDRIIQIAGTFSSFNFDMLKALVEEMNRYDEAPHLAMQMLNAKPEYSDKSMYDVHLKIDDKLIGKEDLDELTWFGNPLNTPLAISYMTWKKDQSRDEDCTWSVANFDTTDLKKIERDGSCFLFENKLGSKITLVKIVKKSYNVWDAL